MNEYLIVCDNYTKDEFLVVQKVNSNLTIEEEVKPFLLTGNFKLEHWVDVKISYPINLEHEGKLVEGYYFGNNRLFGFSEEKYNLLFYKRIK